MSPAGKLVIIADKISNLRDVATNPPSDWSQERCKEYADWANYRNLRTLGVIRETGSMQFRQLAAKFPPELPNNDP
jgi:hypothetical protein